MYSTASHSDSGFLLSSAAFVNAEVFIRNAKWLLSSSFKLCNWHECEDFISLEAFVSSSRWIIVFVTHRRKLRLCRTASDSFESLSCLHNGLLLLIPESRRTSGKILLSLLADNITDKKCCLFQWEIVFLLLRARFEIEMCWEKVCVPEKACFT